MKKSEKRYFSEDKKTYLLVIGNSFCGLFNSQNELVGQSIDQGLDMYKMDVNKKIYLLRILKNKGVAFAFELLHNDINLKTPIIYKIPTAKQSLFLDTWIDLDDVFKCLLKSD